MSVLVTIVVAGSTNRITQHAPGVQEVLRTMRLDAPLTMTMRDTTREASRSIWIDPELAKSTRAALRASSCTS